MICAGIVLVDAAFDEPHAQHACVEVEIFLGGSCDRSDVVKTVDAEHDNLRARRSSATLCASAYNRSCASCHGKTGMGDGPAGKQLNPPPSNLADAEWKHGSTDPEIFTVIRSGIPKTAMKGFASKMTEHEIWDVIN